MEFRDLRTQYKKYKNEIDDAVLKVLESGTFIGGEEVKRLEKRLANYVGVKHCISCANGTDALTLVLMAWDVKQGDAVFVPDFTFFATAEAPAFLGATPIFVDVDEDTFNMDPEKLEEAILYIKKETNLNLKAVIPVDLFGLPANYPKILPIAKKYNMKVLEDAAQGFGGSIDDKKAGSFGDAAITSFFPAKPLGCYGDGGAIFTNDDNLVDLLKSLKVHGKGIDKYDNTRIGMNSRLDSLQAAILNVKLDAFINHELEEVNMVAQHYNGLLSNVVKTPVIPKDYKSSYAQYTIKLSDDIERDKVKQILLKNEIPSMIYYVKPLSSQLPFINSLGNISKNDNSVNLSKSVLSLPMHPNMDLEDIKRISKLLRYGVNNEQN